MLCATFCEIAASPDFAGILAMTSFPQGTTWVSIAERLPPSNERLQRLGYAIEQRRAPNEIEARADLFFEDVVFFFTVRDVRADPLVRRLHSILGSYRAYATSRENTVVLDFDGKKVVVTPEMPTEFAEAVRSHQAW